MLRGRAVTVWLTEHALNSIAAEAERIYPLETGGVLLGWRSGSDRVIADMRGPGPAALHGRYRFFPDHPWQISEIRQAFRESRGDLDYLGDWHSHPDGFPLMSPEDLSTLRRISRKVREPVTLIVAGGQKTWTTGCWRGSRPGTFFSRFVVLDESTKQFVPPKGWNTSTEPPQV